MSFSVVVMAAGQGTRMRSRVPKVLHPVCGRPMVHWPVLAAQAAGAEAVVVVGGPDRALEGRLPEGVVLAVQPVPDGTGGAVAAGLGALAGDLGSGPPAREPVPGALHAHGDGDGAIVVLSGDVPLVTADAISDLVATHAAGGAAATMATTILDEPAGYGRVVRAADGSVECVVETKADGDATPEQLAIAEVNTGIFCFDGPALRQALPRVGSDNAQNERYLPDVLAVLRADGLAIAAHVVEDQALVAGVNDREQLAHVDALAQRRILTAHQRAGVTVLAPHATRIEADVTIGADTLLEPGTVLRGVTTIGAGCTIGPNTTLVDTALGDAVTVLHTYADGAVVHDGVRIGPFAYLRPGTVLRRGAKVGAFVEVKNSDIGEGAKVPHLSYIGDADVGRDSNLGAATITANYDGRAKHRTTIGARVRSAVDVSFVAPVTIGDDAVTAAGSVIDEDVPPGALGIARARQTNIEGYAARKRKRSSQD